MIFRWPWISAARHDDALRMLNTAIGERDHQISELQAERKMLWDKMSILGLGFPVFAGSQVQEPAGEEAASTPATPAREPILTNPAAIVRKMSAQKRAQWLAKHDRKAQDAEAVQYFANLEAVSNGQ